MITQCKHKDLAVRAPVFASWLQLVTNDYVIIIVIIVNAITVSVNSAIM